MEKLTPNKPKAIALISGGLDSMLAAKVVMNQGVEVEGVNFYTGFCVEGHTHALREKRKRGKGPRNNALWVADQLGIKLHIVDVVEPYKEVVLNPKHGYGKNLNPCLDCKIFMVSRAMDLVAFDGSKYEFAITGEVLGQRPKSQSRDAMPIIVSDSGVHDRLLRPLCAAHFPPTLPERNGWVDRAKLPMFNGRTRKPQIKLAEELGFSDYAQPAGGCCFLTNDCYSSKLKDLWAARGSREYELDDILLLKVGRHIRPNQRFKLIVGRESGENHFLRGYTKRFTHIDVTSHIGPVTLVDGEPNADDIQIAAKLAARYSQGRGEPSVETTIHFEDGTKQDLLVTPYDSHEVPDQWHIGV